MLPATVALGLMIMAGVASYRRVRSKMKYETWWVTHLYFYIAVVISFGHQIESGRVFLSHPWLKPLWIGIYLAVAVTIVVGRVLLPVSFSLRHRLRVAAVVEENKDVVSIYITGKNLDQLKAKGGQFFQWRFMIRHWWWQAHPYSLSAMPRPPYLRVTIKDLGDASGASRWLRPGTRVAIEGPYGAFRMDRRVSDRVVLVGAVVGITPLRALLATRVMRRLPFGVVIGLGPVTAFVASLMMALTTLVPSPLLAGLSFFMLGAGPILWVISPSRRLCRPSRSIRRRLP